MSFSDDPKKCLLNSPGALAVEADGSLLVADSGNHRIIRVSPDGSSAKIVLGIGNYGIELVEQDPLRTQLNQPCDVVVADDGSIFVNDVGNHRVLRLAHDASKVDRVVGTNYPGDALVVNDPAKTELNRPTGIAVGSDESVIVGDRDNHRVLRVAPDLQTVEPVIGIGQEGSGFEPDSPGACQLSSRKFVAVGQDGSIIVTDSGNNRILSVASDRSKVMRLVGTDHEGRSLDPTRPEQTELSQPGRARPAEVEMSPNGSLLLIDSGNHRVLRLARDGCSVDSVIGQKSPGILLYHDNPQLSFLNSPH